MNIMIRVLVMCAFAMLVNGNGWALEMPWEKEATGKGAVKRGFSQLSEADKKAVLDCICKCNSRANLSAVSVYYTTAPNDASPACADVKNGPCINQGFGCWRHFPPASGNCMKECTSRYAVDSVPEEVLNAGR